MSLIVDQWTYKNRWLGGLIDGRFNTSMIEHMKC